MKTMSRWMAGNKGMLAGAMLAVAAMGSQAVPLLNAPGVAQVGDMVTVTIEDAPGNLYDDLGMPGAGIFAADLQLSFDPLLLQFQSEIAASPWFLFTDNSTPGLLSIVLGAVEPDVDPLGPVQTLATFKFKAIAAGAATGLDLSVPAGGVYGTASSFATVSTTLDITGAVPPVPEPSSMALSLAGLLGLAACLRRRTR